MYLGALTEIDIYQSIYLSIYLSPQSAGTLEYGNCISSEG